MLFLKKILSIGIVAMIMFGCSSKPPEVTLKESAKEYIECLNDEDSECIAEMTNPAIIEKIGDKDIAEDGIEEAFDQLPPFTSLKYNISKINQIEKKEGYLSATIDVIVNIKQGFKLIARQKGKIIAISKDNGDTWYFQSEFFKNLN